MPRLLRALPLQLGCALGLHFHRFAQLTKLALLIDEGGSLRMEQIAEDGHRRNQQEDRHIAHLGAATLLRPTRDNGLVPYIPTGLIHQGELAAQIERAKSSLGPEVAHVAYRIGEDSTGEASIFFRITLLDWAIAENLITDVTGRVATILFSEVRPLDNWGLRPYFNFRSLSEQQKRPDPDWI